MAKIVLTVGGYVLGNLLLPGLGGAIGGLVGGYVGGIVDQQLFGGTASQTVYGARMQDLRVQSSSYGAVIPILYGKGRLAANVIWMRGFDEEVRTETQTVGGGGKGGGGVGTTTTTVPAEIQAVRCEVRIDLPRELSTSRKVVGWAWLRSY